jgi:hypothetical protein
MLNSQIPSIARAVTPSDATVFGAASLLISVGGTLVVECEGDAADTSQTLTVPAGYFVCRVRRVLAATTCTGITRFSNQA